MIDFKDKTVLVTGGGSGIGRATAEAFGKAGARVVVAEINPEFGAEVGAALQGAGVEALVVEADVTRSDDIARLTTAIKQRFGALDVLVNNVGHYLVAKPFEQFSDDEIDRLYSLNLRHIFDVTRAMLPLLRLRGAGASIISMSSIEGLRGAPTCSVYAAFKAAVGGFTRTLALELAPEGIRVNEIALETTDTRQLPISLAIPDANKHHIPRWIPLGRFGQPQDCAGAALYLASPLASWVTGTTLTVDGGAMAAGGWMRDPSGAWTTMPLITGNGYIDSSSMEPAPAA